MSFINDVMAPEARSHIFWLASLFFHWYKILRRQTRIVEDVKDDTKGFKKRLLHGFDIEDQAFMYTNSPRTYKRDSCRRDLFHAFLSERAVQFWRKDLTLESSLETVDYSVRGETLSKHLRWENVMSNIPRLPRNEMLYRDERTPKAKSRCEGRNRTTCRG